ncbi:hypothetical protein B7494_g962 [Chlorociboria aeruginascens]|nr:hypothetical protein B7494_g962 [Chlorociboria aeruginascens]
MAQFSTPESRWHALQTRNPLAASSFIYSVTTTKIFCRPTCPSRLARRANIIFHNSAAEAEAAGYRACKRCTPDRKEGEGDKTEMMILRACALVKEEKDQKWSVKALAKEVGLTESHFCRVFRKGGGGDGASKGDREIRGDGRDAGHWGENEIERGQIAPARKDIASDTDVMIVEPQLATNEADQLAIDTNMLEIPPEWYEFSGSLDSNDPLQMLSVFDNTDFDFNNLDMSTPGLISDQSTTPVTTTDEEFIDFGFYQ